MSGAAARWRIAGIAIALLILAGCASPPPPSPERRPNPDSGGEQIDDSLQRLRRGDDAGARTALERALRLGSNRGVPADSAQFLRDLAELRLATGDPAGAEAAAAEGLERLAQVPLTAQFGEEDREVSARLLQSLRAAGARSLSELEALARADVYPPLADPWYLLGWTLERHGDPAAARVAFRAYLDRSPQFGLLRRSRLMRQHAEAVVAGR